MRHNVTLGAIAFGVILAVVIGVRLDQAALTVIVGIACGVGASIPTGLLIVYLLRRRDISAGMRGARGHGRDFSQLPPVVVVAPPAAPQLPQPAAWPGSYGTATPSRRQFAVIGEEGIDDGFDD